MRGWVGGAWRLKYAESAKLEQAHQSHPEGGWVMRVSGRSNLGTGTSHLRASTH